MNGILILSGAEHLQDILKKEIKDENIKVNILKIESKIFPDNEQYVRIPIKIPNKAIIINSFYKEPDKRLIETIFTIRTLKELDTKKILGIFPYLAYTRQDKRYKEGEAISQLITLELLKFSGLDRLITIDAHFHQGIPKIEGLTIKNLTCSSLFSVLFQKIKNNENFVVIGPDDDAYKLALNLSKELNLKAGYIKKRRLTERKVIVNDVTLDVKNKNAILIDDLISTGGTILEAQKLLKSKGAKEIYVLATHGLFVSNSLKKLKDSGIKFIATSNTIPNEVAKLNISKLIIKEIKTFIEND